MCRHSLGLARQQLANVIRAKLEQTRELLHSRGRHRLLPVLPSTERLARNTQPLSNPDPLKPTGVDDLRQTST